MYVKFKNNTYFRKKLFYVQQYAFSNNLAAVNTSRNVNYGRRCFIYHIIIISLIILFGVITSLYTPLRGVCSIYLISKLRFFYFLLSVSNILHHRKLRIYLPFFLYSYKYCFRSKPYNIFLILSVI